MLNFITANLNIKKSDTNLKFHLKILIAENLLKNIFRILLSLIKITRRVFLIKFNDEILNINCSRSI
jgi:hypothetical protein